MSITDEVDAVSGEFGIGLRVLLVDDDLFCLQVVGSLLQTFQFNVTATLDPIEALKMLREDKSRFEIVIVDVNMSEIVGFKLLELIRREIGIPVIILSALQEMTYAVEGFELGACDYIVKPCRIRELRSIWRHVSKRTQKVKKKNSRNQGDGQALAQPENPKIPDDSIAGRKRKNRNEGEEDKNGGIKTEDRDMTHKKQRINWSEELHNKFLAAVDNLSLEKAAPKKILELMNVEGLTRDHVASHLQKYRAFLKRTEEAAQQKQETTRSMEGFQLPEYRIFRAIPFSSAQPSEVLGRFNSPYGFNMNLIVSPGLTVQNTSQSMNNSFGLRPQNQLPELYHGCMTPLEINPISNLSGFSCPNNRVAFTSSMHSRPRSMANPLFLQGNQHVLRAAPLKSEPFHGLCQGVHLCYFPSTGSGPFEPHYHREMPWNSSGKSHASSLIGQPWMNAVENPHPSILVDVPGHDDLIGSAVQMVNSTEKPNGEEHQPFSGEDPNHSTANPPPLDVADYDISQLIIPSDDNNASNEQHNNEDKPTEDSGMGFNAKSFFKLGEDGFLQCNYDAFDDMVIIDYGQELQRSPTPTEEFSLWEF